MGSRLVVGVRDSQNYEHRKSLCYLTILLSFSDPHVGLRECLAAFHRVPQVLRDHLAAMTGNETKLIGGSVDTLYIPGRLPIRRIYVSGPTYIFLSQMEFWMNLNPSSRCSWKQIVFWKLLFRLSYIWHRLEISRFCLWIMSGFFFAAIAC